MDTGTVLYGRRLLPSLIDERARSNHSRPYASIPFSKNVADGFRDISYCEFAQAINKCALWIIDQFGRSSNADTLVYLGLSDLRYQILAMAAVKTGHVVRTPSDSRCAVY